MFKKPDTPKLLVVSGKKGAGKDTLAPLLAAQLTDSEPVHMSFAGPLKDEIDVIMQICRDHDAPADAQAAISQHLTDAPVEVAERLVSILHTAVHENPLDHARSHSPAAVEALQYYGTQFRRAQDPDYWVKIAVANAAAAIREGKFPYFTDARFPNEVEHLAAIGGLTVRLEIDREEQVRRLLARDGRVPNTKELNHRSETALDGYYDFHVRLITRDGVDETLKATLALAA